MGFAADIEEEAGEEPIEAVVIGEFGWGDGYKETAVHLPASARIGELLSWGEARPLLDYEYNDSFGASDCHAITAWTATRVFSIIEYDGSTRVFSLPRSPAAHVPVQQ